MQGKKMKLVITGEDVDGKIYKRTVEGNTEMAPEDVRGSLKMLSDKGLLKTFCAAMEVYENEIEVYNDIDQCINNVKNENWYLTGADNFLEEAEDLLANGEYWEIEEESDITPQELAMDLEFNSTYHATSLGILRTD